MIVHLNKRQHDELYPKVVEKQGGLEFCNGCGLSLRQLQLWDREPLLVIDRIDNTGDYRLENCQLLCKSCNKKKNPIKPRIFERAITPEMIKNMKGEPMFRRWLCGEILKRRHIPYEEAVGSGAEFCELSTETIKRYLKKMLSQTGSYELGWASGGSVDIYEKGDAPDQDDPYGHLHDF